MLGLLSGAQLFKDNFLVDSVSLEQMNYRIEGAKDLIQMMKTTELSPPKPKE